MATKAGNARLEVRRGVGTAEVGVGVGQAGSPGFGQTAIDATAGLAPSALAASFGPIAHRRSSLYPAAASAGPLLGGNDLIIAGLPCAGVGTSAWNRPVCAFDPERPVTLFGDFLREDHRRTHKWYHYFPVYERHFERFRNRHLTLFEIGVGEGGSLAQWRGWLGPFARIVGIDINPACAQLEEEEIHIRIGSQDDPAFLERLLDEFGDPDIVIDDGSHQQAHVRASFDILYPRVAKNGIYLVEDLHAAYWPNHGGGIRRPGSFIEAAKGIIDRMHAEHVWVEGPEDVTPRSALGDRTSSIHFYDSVVVFEVGEYRAKRHRLSGNSGLFRADWQPGMPPPAAPAAPRATAGDAAAGAPAMTADPQAEARTLAEAMAQVHASTSWRITSPLRALGRLLGR